MSKVVVFNFSHPMTEEQKKTIIEDFVTGNLEDIEVIDVPVQIDPQGSVEDQVRLLVLGVLKHPAWADFSTHIIINPPGLSYAAVVVAEELMRSQSSYCYVRLRRGEGVPPRYVVAEYFGGSID